MTRAQTRWSSTGVRICRNDCAIRVPDPSAASRMRHSVLSGYSSVGTVRQTNSTGSSTATISQVRVQRTQRDRFRPPEAHPRGGGVQELFCTPACGRSYRLVRTTSRWVARVIAT